MDRYKKVIKRKSASDDILSIKSGSIADWLTDNAGKLSASFAAVILTIASVYGFFYYRSVSITDAKLSFYHAASLAPVQGANRKQGQEAIVALGKLAESGGMAQSADLVYLEMASLQSRSGAYEDAIVNFHHAAKKSEKGSLNYELAQAGLASALIRSGKAKEAAPVLKELSITANSYPRSDALYTLAFAYAETGEKDAAIGALNKIKSDYPAFLVMDFVDDLIRRIDADELERAFIETVFQEPAPLGDSPQEASPRNKIGVHTRKKGSE